MVTAKETQWANFADFCNACSNCDTFCPEVGGPYKVKPRFFGSLASWEAAPSRDGYVVEGSAQAGSIRGRYRGVVLLVEVDHWQVHFVGPGFDVRFAEADPAGTIAGEAEGEVDLTRFYEMRMLQKAVLDEALVNYINVLNSAPGAS